ncbi:MAG TPA: type II secretion system F family protein [Gammaproteobacteria bacterium]|nr:type II secretion system F family protein [Gammaproteobacteria bacterium]
MEGLWISVLIGVALSLGLAGVYGLFRDVPREDRTYLDRPLLGFRLGWPLIRLGSYYLGRWITPKFRREMGIRLRRAGMEYALKPDQFLMGQYLMAGVAMAFSTLLAGMLHREISAVWLLLSGVGGYFYPVLWLKETTDRRNRAIFRALPFYLDIIILAVESGGNFTGGLTQAVRKAQEGPLKLEFGRVLRDVRAGKPRAEALRDLATRVDSEGIQGVVSSIIQAEQTGSSLGGVLRAQADQLRARRFQRAEKLAMEAPVKLLGPLVMFIFPNTFLVLGFLLLSKALLDGLIDWPPLVWAYHWPWG